MDKNDTQGNDFIADVINCLDELEPVLAEIEHINSLGKSTWYEVVYYNDKWYSYSGSKTFEDGEKVIKWKYAKDCIADVSQQRELLNAFQEYYQKGDYNDEYSFDENVNRFLKAFNCIQRFGYG